jgi:hypothetical protein
VRKQSSFRLTVRSVAVPSALSLCKTRPCDQ